MVSRSSFEQWSNMVQYCSMVPWWFRVVQHGLMILNGTVVQYGPILFDGPMVVQGSPIWSNGYSWWSWLVAYVCEGLSAIGVKANGRLTLCVTCMSFYLRTGR